MPIPIKLLRELPSIYIPTYNRWNWQKTLEWLPEPERKRVVLVIRPEEFKQATELIKAGTWGTIRKLLVCNKPGVAAARQEALEDSQTDTVIMLDDDLRFCHRPIDWHFEKNPTIVKSDVYKVAKSIQFLTMECNITYPMIGLGARGGNNQIEQRYQILSTRIMRSFAVHKPTLLKEEIRFDRFYYWEDFHVCLSLLERGYVNMLNVDLVTDEHNTNSIGGIPRDVKKMWECITDFSQLHPTIRVKEKPMNSKQGDGTKIMVPDMTVYWKKSLGTKLHLRKGLT